VNKFSVLLPCYKGGLLFRRAVESIVSSKLPATRIIISFNNYQDENEAWLHALIKKGFFGDIQVVILNTKNELTALEHWLYICDCLKEDIKPNELLFLMAHDDWLGDCSNLNVNTLYEQQGTVYFPNYKPTKDINIRSYLPFNVDLLPRDWFWYDVKETVFTNMSGMIIPFYLLEEISKLSMDKKTGTRFEHSLALSKKTKYLKYLDSVNVNIYIHANQSGALINTLESRIDDLWYYTFVKNNVEMSLVDNVKIRVLTCKKLISIVLCYFKFLK